MSECPPESELSAEGWAIVRATIASWDRLPLSIGEALVAKAFRELEAKARCSSHGGDRLSREGSEG